MPKKITHLQSVPQLSVGFCPFATGRPDRRGGGLLAGRWRAGGRRAGDRPDRRRAWLLEPVSGTGNGGSRGVAGRTPALRVRRTAGGPVALDRSVGRGRKPRHEAAACSGPAGMPALWGWVGAGPGRAGGHVEAVGRGPGCRGRSGAWAGLRRRHRSIAFNAQAVTVPAQVVHGSVYDRLIPRAGPVSGPEPGADRRRTAGPPPPRGVGARRD